jgi:hypothetical protein
MQPATRWQPKVQLLPVDGGLHHNNIISQEAINYLSKYVWLNSPDIYMLTKLMPAWTLTCLDFEQVAKPMVHPLAGETISSHKKLMRTPPWLKCDKQHLEIILVIWCKAI